MNGVVFQTSMSATAQNDTPRIGDEGDVAVQDAELVDEQVVEDAVDVVVHPLPHLGRDDGRYGPGDEHGRAHRRAPLGGS